LYYRAIILHEWSDTAPFLQEWSDITPFLQEWSVIAPFLQEWSDGIPNHSYEWSGIPAAEAIPSRRRIAVLPMEQNSSWVETSPKPLPAEGAMAGELGSCIQQRSCLHKMSTVLTKDINLYSLVLKLR